MNRKLKAQIIKQYGAQYKFARELNTQETVVSAVINGKRELKPDEMTAWSKALGVNIREFIDARN